MAPKFAIIILTGEQWESSMAKVADAVAALQSLTSAVNAATSILTAPTAPAADDPAMQPLVDQLNALGSGLAGAVDAYKAAHPS